MSTDYLKNAKRAWRKFQAERLQYDRKFLRNGNYWENPADDPKAYWAFINKHMADAKAKESRADTPPAEMVTAKMDSPTSDEVAATIAKVRARISDDVIAQSYVINEEQVFSDELKKRDPERWEQICAIPIGGIKEDEQ